MRLNRVERILPLGLNHLVRMPKMEWLKDYQRFNRY
jgi:hypothetical protein